jgi:hypothetical protein
MSYWPSLPGVDLPNIDNIGATRKAPRRSSMSSGVQSLL